MRSPPSLCAVVGILHAVARGRDEARAPADARFSSGRERLVWNGSGGIATPPQSRLERPRRASPRSRHRVARASPCDVREASAIDIGPFALDQGIFQCEKPPPTPPAKPPQVGSVPETSVSFLGVPPRERRNVFHRSPRASCTASSEACALSPPPHPRRPPPSGARRPRRPRPETFRGSASVPRRHRDRRRRQNRRIEARCPRSWKCACATRCPPRTPRRWRKTTRHSHPSPRRTSPSRSPSR